MSGKLRTVFIGLSITSSWGNGHATTYRGLLRELAALGHDVLFLERDVPWYASNRDLSRPPWCRAELYSSLAELETRFEGAVRDADLVVVGSYVPEGVAVGEWVTTVARGLTALYDIDTPVTLSRLERGDAEYLSPGLVPRYRLYLSFTGGPTLEHIARVYGALEVRPLYCSFDPALYFPERITPRWDFGYMGTYSDDRQPALERLLIEPARAWAEGRFAVAGPLYPAAIAWPEHVTRLEHVAPSDHRRFYCAQRFTLNVTRAHMVRRGYSPSVRLFEAAACATPIVSDPWEGLDTFFEIDREILIARTADEVLEYLRAFPEAERRKMGLRARRRALSCHTAAHRARELEAYALELLGRRPRGAVRPGPLQLEEPVSADGPGREAAASREAAPHAPTSDGRERGGAARVHANV
jgi:spore maturation protein CgeB